MHVMQIDWGLFSLAQSSYNVGQVVSQQGDQGATIEYWYLFATGQGSPPQGMAPYTYPSSSAQSVTTTYAYQGAPPDHFDPELYRDELQQQIGEGLVVQYIRADCSAPQPGGARRRARASTVRGKAKRAAKPKAKAKAKPKKAAAKSKRATKAKPAAKRKSR